jgi:large subunit ribosomal protein L4e
MKIVLLTNNLYCRKKVVRRMRRLNPLCNTRTLLRLNPYAAVLKREAILSPQKRQMGRDEMLAKKRKVSTYCN